MDKIRKLVIKTFKDGEMLSLTIEIKTNLKKVSFFDVTSNFKKGTYSPCKKPNNKKIYINTLSDHTPPLIKHLSTSANEKLSKKSSNEEIFPKSKVDYQKALKESGFQSTKLAYKNRRRNII